MTALVLLVGLAGFGTMDVAADGRLMWLLPWTTSPSGHAWHDIGGSTYGCDRHTGADYYAIDFALNYEPVGAIARGVVYATGYDSQGGNYIIINQQDGYYSYYGHLSSIGVSRNQTVREGDVVGTSGQSGPAGLQPHLHFRVTSGGPSNTPVKPEPMGGTTSPSQSFGDWGDSLRVGCAFAGRGPGYWASAPAVGVTQTNGSGGYYLDGYGGINLVAGAPVLTSAPYWEGWNIARDFKLCPSDSSKGYLLDGYGGIWPVGSATPVPQAYRAYFGVDIARSIAISPDCQSGYTLDGYGGVHPFAANGVMPPTPTNNASWPGWDIARAIVLQINYFGYTNSGYTLDGFGGVHKFNNAPDINPPTGSFGWDIARGLVITMDFPCCSGYLVDGFGGVHPFGPNAPAVSLHNYWSGLDGVRGISAAGAWKNSGKVTGYFVDLYGGINPYSSPNCC